MMRRPPPHRGAGYLGQDGHLLHVGCTFCRHLSQFIKHAHARFLVNKFPRKTDIQSSLVVLMTMISYAEYSLDLALLGGGA
jgi:hypothetical protein